MYCELSARRSYYTLCAVGEKDAPGCQWRSAASWPPEGTEAVRLPFGGNATIFLSDEVKSSFGFRNFTFDPSNPCPTIGGANLDTKFGNFSCSRFLPQKLVPN